LCLSYMFMARGCGVLGTDESLSRRGSACHMFMMHDCGLLGTDQESFCSRSS